MTETLDVPAIRAIHHLALRCRDAEETRAFYEGVLGLEFAGAFKITEDPASAQPHEYVHIFFKMQGGDFVAFFDDPATARPEMFGPKNPFDAHFALNVEGPTELQAFQKRFEQAGLPVVGPIDHDICLSIYTYDPNGFPVEITHKAATHDQQIKDAVTASPVVLSEWSAATAEMKRALASPTAA